MRMLFIGIGKSLMVRSARHCCMVLLLTFSIPLLIIFILSSWLREFEHAQIENLKLQVTSLMSHNLSVVHHEKRSEEMFFNEIQNEHVKCKQTLKLGEAASEGQDVCFYGPYNFQTPCLIYSFGWSEDMDFEEDAAERGCTVRLFVFKSKFTGKINTGSSVSVHFVQLCGRNDAFCYYKPNFVIQFQNIYTLFQEETQITDIVKIDLKFDTMVSFLNIAVDSSWLDSVKQLILHIQLHEVNHVTTTNNNFHSILQPLAKLEERGFRKFKVIKNLFGVTIFHGTRGGYLYSMDHYKNKDMKSCCYDLFYVNGKFIDIFN